MIISKEDLDNIDMIAWKKAVEWTSSAEYFDKPAGEEFYRLIAYLAQQMPAGCTFVDIGTYFGLSAAALASNEGCQVKTYDIYDHITDNIDTYTIKNVNNIEFLIKDCLDDADVLAKASIIVLDVDPHDGLQETEIVAKLRAVGFKGVLIVDDIKLNDKMKQFWNEIPERKKDVSTYGHWSGTGIVYFSDDIQIEFA